ncbi:MAG: sugar phosphate isomerase/epimerase [Chloroflexi bacterium]|nr:sugar phosphate isomerase/epimerase [Chloroflexota bacterium]
MSARVPAVGIYNRSLPGGDRLDAPAALRAARDLGLAGCLFASPLAISAALDLGAVRAARALADDLGLRLGLGVGRIHPYHIEREADVLALGDGDFRAGLTRLVAAGRAAGCHDLWFSVGTLADRFDRTVPWSDQLAAVAAFLVSFAPVLRDAGCRLCLKTHEEITTFEVARLVEAVGADVLGVSLDPVNVLARIEEPVAAARRVAPYVRHVHLDDAIVRFTAAGIERKLYPVGQGVVDWPAILALLAEQAPDAAYWIELHRGQFSMPLFEPGWLAAQPDLTLAELAVVMQFAVQGERRLTSGVLPPPEAYQADPTRRLAPALAWLRGDDPPREDA